MNVMNGMIAVGITVAGIVLIVIWAALMNRWPAEIALGTFTVLVLAIIFMIGAQA